MERDVQIQEMIPNRKIHGEKLRKLLEEEADRLLIDYRDNLRTYSERALARKIRLENERLPEVEETRTSNVVTDYLLHRQIELLIGCARLSKLQASVLSLALSGWHPAEISSRFGISYQIVKRALRIAQSRIAGNSSPYDGLYEVYWQEVNRYVYRKRRTKITGNR